MWCSHGNDSSKDPISAVLYVSAEGIIQCMVIRRVEMDFVIVNLMLKLLVL